MTKKMMRPKPPKLPLDEAQVRLLSKPEVCAIVGYSFPTIWQMMREGDFPLSVEIGGQTRWVASEIDDFIKNAKRSKLKPLTEEEKKKLASKRAKP